MIYWIHFGLVALSRSNYGTNGIGIKLSGRKLQKDPKCSKTILSKVKKKKTHTQNTLNLIMLITLGKHFLISAYSYVYNSICYYYLITYMKIE